MRSISNLVGEDSRKESFQASSKSLHLSFQASGKSLHLSFQASSQSLHLSFQASGKSLYLSFQASGKSLYLSFQASGQSLSLSLYLSLEVKVANQSAVSSVHLVGDEVGGVCHRVVEFGQHLQQPLVRDMACCMCVQQHAHMLNA